MTVISEEAVNAAHEAYDRVAAINPRLSYSTRVAVKAALTAALPFLPVQVAVKKLDWIRPPLSDTLSRCDTDFGTYRTWTHDEANGKWFWSVEGGWNEANGEAPNEEAAKAAAQADYEARIRSALEPSAARSLALEERLQAIEQQLVVNLGYFHDEKRILLETLQSHIVSHISAIRALSSPDHADDLAVDRFAVAMKEKLAKKRAEGRGGWENKDECSAEYLSYLLIQHIWKGDPLDIGNIAMMLQQRGDRVIVDSEAACIIPHSPAYAGKLVEGDGGWQSMDTAPEDGTVILVYRDDAGVFTAHYVEEDAHLSSPMNPPEGDFYWFSTGGDDLSNDMPTHWRPLPSAPSQEVAGS
ncbi:hypothetical protein [Brucella anthropi]|uniref:hypothetical protein n=1 Tax=Brucella anthropi TaxID=529 RepID=UPI001CFEC3BA|nr:hypothetical protein [Brucella anthropi]